MTVRRLVGVYNAEGSIRGEVTYFVGARFGRAHCALCDITHGLVRERADWKRCRAALPIPFAAYHLDDQPAAVREAADGVAPVVVAETDAGLLVLLGPDALDACAGSPERLTTAIDRAVSERGLRWSAD